MYVCVYTYSHIIQNAHTYYTYSELWIDLTLAAGPLQDYCWAVTLWSAGRQGRSHSYKSGMAKNVGLLFTFPEASFAPNTKSKKKNIKLSEFHFSIPK